MTGHEPAVATSWGRIICAKDEAKCIVPRRTIAGKRLGPTGAFLACALFSSDGRGSERVSTVWTSPEFNQVATANVGDPMLEQGSLVAAKGILLSSADNIMNRRFSAGFYPQISEDQKYTYHSFLLREPEDGLGALSGIKDVKSLRASKLEQKLCIGLPVTAFGIKACDTKQSYERTERTSNASATPTQTVTYEGIVGHVIKVGYRALASGASEHRADAQAEYDLQLSNIIVYKGSRMKIIAADPASIQYIVLSGF